MNCSLSGLMGSDYGETNIFLVINAIFFQAALACYQWGYTFDLYLACGKLQALDLVTSRQTKCASHHAYEYKFRVLIFIFHELYSHFHLS